MAERSGVFAAAQLGSAGRGSGNGVFAGQQQRSLTAQGIGSGSVAAQGGGSADWQRRALAAAAWQRRAVAAVAAEKTTIN